MFNGPTVAFTALRSRNPVLQTRTEYRLDPFWDGLWEYAESARWMGLTTKRRLDSRGVRRLHNYETRWTEDEACALLATHKPMRRSVRLGALAAVGMWRTITVDQLAAFIGSPALTRSTSMDRQLLLASGLVQEGGVELGPRGGGHLLMLRPDYKGDIDLLASKISYPDWVGTTAAQPWVWGSQYTRHNLLGTELGLRVAEYCDVAATFGESLGNLGLLAPAQCHVATSRRTADAVILRTDGMRIAVEMTATTNSAFAARVDKWAEVIERDTSRSLAVVFVECAHPDRDESSRMKPVLDAIRKNIHEAGRATMNRVSADVADRLMFARWRDWFPQPGTVSSLFPLLPALRATGARVDNRWDQVEIANQFDLIGPVAGTADQVVANAHSLYGTPHWLRDPRLAPDLDLLVTQRSGLPDAVSA